MKKPIEWKWLPFEKLTTNELYEILKAREQVFAIDQSCLYTDLDGHDQKAWHLFGLETDGKNFELACYLRVTLPGTNLPNLSISRVLTLKKYRKQGLAKIMTNMALQKIDEKWPDEDIAIIAQAYLESFYKSFNFQSTSCEPYLHEGIPHLNMTRFAKNKK